MSDGWSEYNEAIKEILAEISKSVAEEKRLRKARLNDAVIMEMGKRLGLIEALEMLRIPIESISLAVELGDLKPY